MFIINIFLKCNSGAEKLPEQVEYKYTTVEHVYVAEKKR